jgi:hypothetical protein
MIEGYSLSLVHNVWESEKCLDFDKWNWAGFDELIRENVFLKPLPAAIIRRNPENQKFLV